MRCDRPDSSGDPSSCNRSADLPISPPSEHFSTHFKVRTHVMFPGGTPRCDHTKSLSLLLFFGHTDPRPLISTLNILSFRSSIRPAQCLRFTPKIKVHDTFGDLPKFVPSPSKTWLVLRGRKHSSCPTSYLTGSLWGNHRSRGVGRFVRGETVVIRRGPRSV